MPRKLVYGTLLSRGYTIIDPYQTQTIEKVLSILRHANRDTPSRDLHRDTMEDIQLAVGSSRPFWDMPYADYECLAPDGWMKFLWKCLDLTPLTIQGPPLAIPAERVHDQHLIDAFVHIGTEGDELQVLKDCCSHLQVTLLSEICSPDGLTLAQAAYDGKYPKFRHHSPQRWPKSYRPKANKWTKWQHALEEAFLPDLAVGKQL